MYLLILYLFLCLFPYLFVYTPDHSKHCDSHNRATSLRLCTLSECEGPMEKAGPRVSKRSDTNIYCAACSVATGFGNSWCVLGILAVATTRTLCRRYRNRIGKVTSSGGPAAARRGRGLAKARPRVAQTHPSAFIHLQSTAAW